MIWTVTCIPSAKARIVSRCPIDIARLACITRKASTASTGAEPTLHTDLAARPACMVNLCCHSHVKPANTGSSLVRHHCQGTLDTISLNVHGVLFPTAPSRVGLGTGCPWGCMWRGGGSCSAFCPSRGKTLSCIVTVRELLFSTVSLYEQSSSIRFSWNMISLLIHLDKAFWSWLFARKITMKNTIH